MIDFKLGDKTSADESQSFSISQTKKLLKVMQSSEDSAVTESEEEKEKKILMILLEINIWIFLITQIFVTNKNCLQTARQLNK